MGRKQYVNRECMKFRKELREFIGNEIKQRGERKYNRLWVRLTINDIRKHFPGKSWRQVYGAIQFMLDTGLLNSGKFSADKFDQACWYSLEV